MPKSRFSVRSTKCCLIGWVADSAAAHGQTQAQIRDRVQGMGQQSSWVVIARRVGFQAVCLHNVEFQSIGLSFRRARFGCTDFRSADMDMSAVFGAVAVADVAAGAAAVVAAVAIGVVAVAAGQSRGDLRDSHLDQIASTFFVVSCQKTTRSGSKSFALSE